MAGFNLSIPEDFLKELTDKDFGDVAGKALNECAPILEDSIKASMRRSVSHPGDSDMIKSVRKNKAKATKTDAWIVNVYPSGYSTNTYSRQSGGRTHRYPVSNALKAIWLEYGRTGQTPKPWLSPAIASCSNKILSECQKIWEREVGAK